ncbi:phosphoribosylformylglycinamidine synthase subunit PurL [Erythrobacter litoralis]|uniref:Phosphoribosylformylglycinamidine synthase subunit PurL n=1 Tax=Erythrobacter litoralis (strain HTCC2594) TaxID=314225 RepID=PURL_ERYLH|nr:phosphoribosylformylglycinamidine synthase subunit PurL [Erythrobacter litoralis]Q2NAT8.1 RecName: Full=Phosphoribosylformylglycinamidine synthase subunit PurL; Short=FGAM synthase; AltName: Full=Formylglycinamide ribonucleotide amidotransferase subunit II; Short=FGAR amidotransferase II; Short=FGAR-AT II; AltName: Full=Glutamine amidotransferase PurL; AltName: Full=Phosphoribosylformylglycinamidine synthase subunit II [Erythrobacter litoralis HTCC2594]ABC63203.1 phosphoribosylformylglycinamid
MSEITPEVVESHGLSSEEYDVILKALGREPNLVELGIFSVMWSEHCSYKSSRLHLKKLPTEAPWVICGPGENAGVIDIGDGHAAIFKMESHNHPSYIEPYQGAATGVGGILRDVFTMGARPVANANALRFGRPEHPKMKHLVQGVVAGIGGYGNCVGVPTVCGETNFHPAYDGNILVNAMTVGVADTDKIFYSAATGVGNPIVYVGSKTGRDGIHGATMASTDFEEDSDAKRPTVQVGDPFTEKLLIEACLELMATDAIVAIQDMGAAGLTSSSVEMATNGKTGIRLDMDKVPCREEGMTPYEMMLSESQERMLMVLKPGKEEMAAEIFKKWELDFAVIGEVTDTQRMVLEFGGEVVCDIPLGPLADEAPLYDRPTISLEEYKAWAKIAPITDAPDSADPGADLLKLMASPNLASRAWIAEQYDSQVGADTLQTGGDAGVVRVHGTKKALAISTDCTPRYCYADPYEGGKQAIAEAYRNLCAVGARPLAVTNCLNFANPQRPEIMTQLVEALRGMGDACRMLDFPIVSGNVSLYNESKATGGGSAILPTPAIGGVGIIDDYERMMTMGFKNAGDTIYLVGPEFWATPDPTRSHLGKSLWLDVVHGRDEGRTPPTDLVVERNAGKIIHELIDDGLVNAVHDVSDGGLAVALAEMALSGGTGADVEQNSEYTAAQWWFGEDQGRYVVTVPDTEALNEALSKGTENAETAQIGFRRIGTVGGDGLLGVSLADLREAHASFFREWMEV